MKAKEFRGKLKLNKRTIANLANGFMKAVPGGLRPTFIPPTCCCTEAENCSQSVLKTKCPEWCVFTDPTYGCPTDCNPEAC